MSATNACSSKDIYFFVYVQLVFLSWRVTVSYSVLLAMLLQKMAGNVRSVMDHAEKVCILNQTLYFIRTMRDCAQRIGNDFATAKE